MPASSLLRDLSPSALVAGFVAVLVGYTSSAVIIFQAAEAAGAGPAQIGAWLSMLGLGMGITSLGLSLYYREPVLTAWSTPGAALLATSLPGYSLPEAIGVFLFSAALVLLCGVTGLFARLMQRIPPSIAAAMLAGVLLRFGIDAFAALRVDFPLVGAMCAAYLIGKRWLPRYTILLVLATGLAVAWAGGDIETQRTALRFAAPAFIMPAFSPSALIGVGIPLFVVSMASQNAPGAATLRAAGYTAPVSPLMIWTGLATLALAPFGGFSVCLAAITAAICMGPEAHPDPARRYTAAAAAGGFYLLAGAFGGSIGTLFDALPQPLIAAVAGLALLSTIANSLHQALDDASEREAAVVTFLVTASGVTLLGVGAAFWGLLGGLAVLALRRRPRAAGREAASSDAESTEDGATQRG
ncbi:MULTISPECIES: benzoate/H(+) symporter BenE family transporter [unclassified Modicisalibacter]|uniref:benzoate/H(+) symporter BenE family transporter n=1 Tax=unclassified Modicisalibacter TaxID=2679913 RepID=UPI001CCAD0A6|nr:MULTISPECIES: benzoate/H(+) symporter BenE family transporter [unclassified Modicisalibacter]MBZ9556622.1 benzoate/H(+) symporter BenE family transporter [Modicisalibacter sp. R2A 31.J]MBZ9574909.1 benzoate/H(+) symporter BenE family transporter [Modicisalibacter sp. MOD 31.J]